MATGEYIQGTTHYANRKTREAVHYQGCRKKGEPSCGGAFTCGKCNKLVGACKGQTDERPDWCDACANARLTTLRQSPACSVCMRPMLPAECGDELPEERVCDGCVNGPAGRVRGEVRMSSKRSCKACESAAAGATTWQVGFVVGACYAEAFAEPELDSDLSEDALALDLCALHVRMGREATSKSYVTYAAKDAARIAIANSAKIK